MMSPADQAGPDVLEMDRAVTHRDGAGAAIGPIGDLGGHCIGESESMRRGETIGHDSNVVPPSNGRHGGIEVHRSGAPQNPAESRPVIQPAAHTPERPVPV